MSVHSLIPLPPAGSVFQVVSNSAYQLKIALSLQDTAQLSAFWTWEWTIRCSSCAKSAGKWDKILLEVPFSSLQITVRWIILPLPLH